MILGSLNSLRNMEVSIIIKRRRKQKDTLNKKPDFRQCLISSRKHAKLRNYTACAATIEELEETYTGVCDICGRTKEQEGKHISLDHCHITGNFRGWLCTACNGGINRKGNLLECERFYLRDFEIKQLSLGT